MVLLLFALTHALQFNEWPFDIGAMTNVRVMTDSPVKEEGDGRNMWCAPTSLEISKADWGGMSEGEREEHFAFHVDHTVSAQAGFTPLLSNDSPLVSIFQLRGILLVVTSVVLLANGYPTRPSEKQAEEVCSLL